MMMILMMMMMTTMSSAMLHYDHEVEDDYYVMTDLLHETDEGFHTRHFSDVRYSQKKPHKPLQLRLALLKKHGVSVICCQLQCLLRKLWK